MTEDEMVELHPQLDGHEFEQAPGVGDWPPRGWPALSQGFSLWQEQGTACWALGAEGASPSQVWMGAVGACRLQGLLRLWAL